MESEIWKDITGYMGKYQISNTGKIKSTVRFRNNKEKLLKQNIGSHGYYSLSLCIYGVLKKYLVHRLVAMEFVPNSEGKLEVNHIDGNKLNNNDYNLEWVSDSENKLHAFRTGLMSHVGELQNNSILTEYQVIKIRKEYSLGNISQTDLAKKYKMSSSAIFGVVHRRNWIHI